MDGFYEVVFRTKAGDTFCCAFRSSDFPSEIFSSLEISNYHKVSVEFATDGR